MTHVPSIRTKSPLRLTTILATLLGLSLIVTGIAQPAQAAPATEGSNATLAQKLEEANRAWYEAKTQLDEARAKQAELTTQIDELTKEVDTLTAEVGIIAEEAYLNGGPMELTVALDSNSFSTLVDKMAIIGQLSWQNDSQIRDLKTKRGDLNEQRAQLDEEVSKQEKSEQEMAKRRQDAQNALEAVNGHPSMGYINSGKPAAAPWSGGSTSCSEPDPTGGPCLTARTAHALSEARKVGFTNYTACNTGGSWGEHPKGRACDMAVQASGFGGEAYGEAKGYGNQLAAWFVENADALGVMYVIWFKQIWQASSGWSTYNGGGDPSSAHTNHVHVSML